MAWRNYYTNLIDFLYSRRTNMANFVWDHIKNNIMTQISGKPLFLSACLAASASFGTNAQSRPNILWLTFEDTSHYEFASYGNPDVHTPVTDSLARTGIRFVNAYSCGPQSSPARSTLITGCYSTTYAMDWHRGRVETPADIFFPQILREAGYWCTNNAKTDYNTKADNKSIWDECSSSASYNSPGRQEGQPFFAVFNCNNTHMSRLTSVHLDGRRDFAGRGLDPDSLVLPEHVPDLPEIRSDYAFHLEGVQEVDTWVGLFLEDLKDRGLDENTIVFVFSDHGGCLPRGKAFSYESTYRVPMFVYLPDRWKHMTSETIGEASERMVNFSDLAPTILSLAGIRPPSYMQGTAFMGEYEGARRQWQIGYMTNRTIHFIPSRSISDGRFKYVRNYIPYKKDALFNYFQWQMPANMAWDRAWQLGRISDVHLQPYERTYSEAFYDLKKDPYELDNLIDSRRHAGKIRKMRDALSAHLRESKDLGLIPVTVRNEGSPYQRVRQEGYDLERLYSLAELTADVTLEDVEGLVRVLAGDEPQEMKFWATVALAQLSTKETLPEIAMQVLHDMLSCGDYMTEQEAAYALCHTDEYMKGMDYLADHPEMTSALEVLSLEPQMKERFTDAVMKMLWESSDSFEGKPRKKMPGAGDGITHRKVLSNLGLIEADKIYGPEVYDIGLDVNRKRRPLKPTP